MLKNYLKIAFRSLWRHKAFTLLNMTGLTIGMSAFFLIEQYVRFEHSYDDFVTKKDRIYRLVTDLKSSAATLHWSSTSMPMAINIKAEYPEVENIVRFHGTTALLKRGDIKFEEQKTVFADSSLFAIFNFPLLQGDAATALKEPFSVVLSQSTAKKYFGDANPIGQTMQFTDSGFITKVTGVMQDLPENSTIKADLLVSMSTRKRFRDSLDYRWGNFGERSYLLLKRGANPAGLQAKMPSFMDRHLGPTFKAQQEEYDLFLEPLKDTYWSTRGGFVNGSRTNAMVFSIIGIFILLIACINFVNLTTARSVERAKEVGIRKAIGAARFQLTSQFLGESIVISLLAFLLAVVLCTGLLPLFNQLAGKTVATGIIDQPASLTTLFAIALLIGLLAGIYPALVLSSFKPISSLKGRFSSGTRGLFLRRSLVVFQFTVSITLIIGTAVVYSQLNYMRNQDLGFSKDQTLVLDTQNDPHKVAFRQEVASLPNVQSISFSGTVPGQGTWSAYTKIQNSRGEMQAADMDLTYVDFGYLEQYKMRLLAGRFFDSHIVTDTMQAMIINEAALKLFGYSTPQAAIGRRFDQWGKKGMIIGVIKNYNFESLQQEIHPLSICLDFNDCNFLSAKLGGHDLPTTIAAIKAKWDQLVPDKPLHYFFLDESFDHLYRAEERFGRLFINFAVLAILISCLGLLGLASYTTLQRTKEVGVRRVLGASVAGIVRLLSVDFLRLVGIAFVIAIPIAWFFMNKWLQDFAYKATLGWWIFAGAGFAAVAIAFATISVQAIKAAVANPVKSLRSE